METDYILRTKNLTKIYKKKKIIGDININIKKGAVYGLVGRNGAGKSTTMKMIFGLVSPTSGEVNFSDEFQEKPDWRLKVSASFGETSFYRYLSAKENMEVQRKSLKIKDKKKSDEILDLMGLGDVGNKPSGHFSLGMKQRLSLSISLLGEPEFLVLDEPTNGLDPVGIKEIRSMITDLHQKGVTIMISSHLVNELPKIVTDYGFIGKGRLIEEFSSEELKERVKPCIVLKVNDTKSAIDLIIDKLNLSDYRIEDREIKFFTDKSNLNVISKLLAEHEIIIEYIRAEGGDYEDYFIKTMERADEKNSNSDKVDDHDHEENEDA
ncbi:MAG: bacitracin ABC transporter ATP-binding protein [Candidatus Improbicoccus pseudotrichonymphae]|uniref:Bacitracin ABC transporter ATP-binding protein n=1 Tax=Candidatus Improbicoccus pseudotrichonymphae TaxID=3033792 RepID=A0AA48IAM4_9FIRM|nr:MAG: bacitracin ABC transporter ATP-binding protein [Candidatus Improbicoccus pseudotrichonymphae]